MKIIIHFILTLFTINLLGQTANESVYTIAEKHIIYSKTLQENREIFIHVPNGFWGMDENIKNYPITFVLDGESQFLNAVSTIDFLSSSPLGNDNMPRSIVVGIPNTSRNRDLTPTKGIMGSDSTTIEITGGGLKFLNFITNEVEPYLDSLYSLSKHRTLIGHSLGGLIVFEALLNKRDYFDNYLAIDPYLEFDNESYFYCILDTLRNANLDGENLFVAVALSSPTFIDSSNIKDDTSKVGKLTKSNLKFHGIANSEDWQFNYSCEYFPNEDHFSVPYIATYKAMKFFYSYYSFDDMISYFHPAYSDRSDLVERLRIHYQEISIQLGFEILPMESYLNSWAYGLSQFDRRDLSVDLFDYNIELYPNRASVYNSKAYFLLNESKKVEVIKLLEKSLKLKKDEEIIKTLNELKNKKAE